MAKSLQQPWFKKGWLASATYTTTVTSAALALPMGDCYALAMVSSTGSGTTPTLDIVIQSSFDGGTSYVNLPLRFTQVTGTAASEVIYFKNGLGGNEIALASLVAATGGQLAKNCLFDPNFLKVVVTVGGSTPSIVMVIHAGVLPSGRQGEL